MTVSLTSDQERLLALGNEVARQLRVGKMDRGALLGTLPDEDRHAPLRPFSRMFSQGVPPTPSGVNLRSLPYLTKMTGGLFGLWVAAGETGVGKTTFALQCALDFIEHGGSVLHYDYENGEEVVANHLGEALGGAKKAEQRTERWYYRENVFSLPHDLGLCACKGRERRKHGVVEKPALIVVDSLQSIVADENAYGVLRRWLRTFEMLARAGYVVILLSEKPRYTYGKAKTSGFADVRAEYKAWVGFQLMESRHDDGVEVHIVKNRHRPYRGHVLNLKRESVVWRFEEERIEDDAPEEEDD